MDESELTLETLANISGLPIRTLRFYIQKGLLPGPDSRGKNASYSESHIERLALIKDLKDKFLPLQEIKALLDGMSDEDIHGMLAKQVKQSSKMELHSMSAPTGRELDKDSLSALDYIKALDKTHEMIQSVHDSRSSSNQQTKPRQLNERVELFQNRLSNQVFKEESWRKYILTEGVELNVQANRDKDLKSKILQLIEFSRNLFGE